MTPATFLRHIPTNTLRMLWGRDGDTVWTIDRDGEGYSHSAEEFAAQYEPYAAADWHAAEMETK